MRRKESETERKMKMMRTGRERKGAAKRKGEWCIFKTNVHSCLLGTTSDIGGCTSKYHTVAYSAYKL